jgi:hypothetical protein
MKHFWLELLMAAMSATCAAQEDLPSPRPHLYAENAFTPSGAGYGSGWAGSLGISCEEKRISASVEVSYGAEGKTGDTTPISPGHTRSAAGLAFYRFGNSFLGGGAGFGETLTTLYSKYAWYPAVGGGRDFVGGRFQATYVRNMNEFTRYPVPQTDLTPPPNFIGRYTPTTCKCNNGVQGIDVDMWAPSPASRHHFFFRANVEPIWFHETVTDPYSTQSWVQTQRNTRQFSSVISAGLVGRF